MTIKSLLFNPVGVVHDRSVEIFKNSLPEWEMRSIYNPRFPWFSDKKRDKNTYFFKNGGHLPKDLFRNVDAVILFSAQPRIQPCSLIEEAALRRIPVIAIEEVHQMILEQGFVNEYFLPVDHLFVASEYERKRFLEIGVPDTVAETVGCLATIKTSHLGTVDDKKRLKDELGIPHSKRVATLSLAYMTPGGETACVRKQLLMRVSDGLPPDWGLIIKPHPAELDNDLDIFVKRYAPRAVIANKYLLIDKILDITDILFNRGNSQVIFDALRRGIPIVPIPIGRKTLFHGLLDEIIVYESDDISKILKLIEEKGIGIYDKLLNTYSSINSKESLKNATLRITQIAKRKELHNPEEHLKKLALFWAWIGYVPRSMRIISHLDSSLEPKLGLTYELGKLILGKTDHNDLLTLKNWASKTYMEWIIQSLWIKSLYINNKKISPEDKEWLTTFPPRMNGAFFLSYAYMLCWIYIRSGFESEARKLSDRLSCEYQLGIKHPCHTVSQYKFMRAGYMMNVALKNIALQLGLS